MLAAVYVQIQDLRKTDAVQFAANFAALLQPKVELLTVEGDMNHFHIVEPERFL